MTISEFRLRHDLNPGLADARRLNAASADLVFPATRAGLALALDTRDHHQLELAGCYGFASCYVLAVMGEGEIAIAEGYGDDPATTITEARAHELLTADGVINPAWVHALHEPVWDGNNHVPYVPSRALAWLTHEERYERIGRARVAWNADGGIEDIKLDSDWVVADEYWGVFGNETWTHGDADVGAREAALEAAGVAYSTVWISDDDVMLLVRESDLDAATQIFEETER